MPGPDRTIIVRAERELTQKVNVLERGGVAVIVDVGSGVGVAGGEGVELGSAAGTVMVGPTTGIPVLVACGTTPAISIRPRSSAGLPRMKR